MLPLFGKLIACTSELAAGQILCLSRENNVFCFSRQSCRVAGMGCKPLLLPLAWVMAMRG